MALTKQQKKVVGEWGDMICRHSKQVDPGDELQWESMFIGFAIGRGLTIDEATDYDLYIDHAFVKEACDGRETT